MCHDCCNVAESSSYIFHVFSPVCQCHLKKYDRFVFDSNRKLSFFTRDKNPKTLKLNHPITCNYTNMSHKEATNDSFHVLQEIVQRISNSLL